MDSQLYKKFEVDIGNYWSSGVQAVRSKWPKEFQQNMLKNAITRPMKLKMTKANNRNIILKTVT